jgi:hypothetical protein
MVYSRLSSFEVISTPCRSWIAWFTTAHQIGTVFDRASGNRFPERVESTMITLIVDPQSYYLQEKCSYDTHDAAGR